MAEYPDFLTGEQFNKSFDYFPDNRVLPGDVSYNPSETDQLIWELNGAISQAVDEQEFWYESYQTHLANVKANKRGIAFFAFYEPIRVLDDVLSLYTGWKAIAKGLAKSAGREVAEAALSNVGVVLETTRQVLTVGAAIKSVYDSLKDAFKQMYRDKSADGLLTNLSKAQSVFTSIAAAVDVFKSSDILGGVVGGSAILGKIIGFQDTIKALTFTETRNFLEGLKAAEIPYETALGNFYYYTALSKQLAYLQNEYVQPGSELTAKDIKAEFDNIIEVDAEQYNGKLKRWSPNLYALLAPSTANDEEPISEEYQEQLVPVYWVPEEVSDLEIPKPSPGAPGPGGGTGSRETVTKKFWVVLTGEGQKLETEESSTIAGNVVNLGTFINKAGHTTTLTGSTVRNDGTITINDGKSPSSAYLVADSDVKLTGTGELKLNRGYYVDNAQLNTTDNGTITNDTKHTISGKGQINAELTNKGTINANVKNQTLYLSGDDKTNDNILTASKGGTLLIQSTINNNKGTLLSNGGTVEISGGKIIGGVLNSKGKSAILGKGGTIEDVTNKGQFNIDSGTTTIAGKTLTNNGAITINDGKSHSYAYLVADSDVKLTGTGELKLNRGYYVDNAQLNTTDNSTITNDTKHTISGKGQINAELTNKGTINANVKNQTLYLSGDDKTNDNILTASKGGTLLIQSTINNNKGTLLSNGGTVEISGGKIIGGVLNSKGKSAILGKGGTIEDVTNKGQFNIDSGTTTIAGKTLTNNGAITINDGKSHSYAYLVADSNVKLTGTGELKLNRGYYVDNAQLNTTDNGTITNDTKHTISGKGQINAELTNKGTINANVKNQTLYLSGNDKTNDNILTASKGGVLLIESTINNNKGTLLSNGGDIELVPGGQVIGGVLNSKDKSAILGKGGTIEDVTNKGQFNIDSGTTTIAGKTLTNNGAITINNGKSSSYAYLVADSNVKLTGTGELKLNRGYYVDNAQLNTTDNGTITNDTKHTISGKGQINAELTNKGTINANVKNQTLYLSGNDKTNDNILTASKGGVLLIESTINNNKGTLLSNGGDIELVPGGQVIGGVLNSKDKSAILGKGGTIEDVINKGQFKVPAGYNATIAGKTLTNNGAITINDGKSHSSAYLVADSNVKLTGTGELKLNRGYYVDNAQLNTTDNGTITNDTKHTISGKGQINAELTNKGTINANVKNQTLYLSGDDKTNLSLLTAGKGGILDISGSNLDNTKGLIQTGTGTIKITSNAIVNNKDSSILANKGNVRLESGGTVIGGILDSKGKSAVVSAGGAVEDITNKGQFNIDSGTTTIAGKTLTNNGAITINDGKSRSYASLVADSDVKLTGTGELKLNRGYYVDNAQLNTTDNGTITNDSKHTITGKGQINAPLTNKGTIAPGLGIGTLNLNNNYQQLKTGVLNIELGKKGNDLLDISGTATLRGTLDVDIVGNFAPKPGDTFTILTADQIKGKFNKIKDATTKNGLTLKPKVTEDGLILTATAGNQNSNDNNGLTKTGNNKNNRLKGSKRDDILDGKRGNDKLYGKNGDDTLIGGGGKDILNGGNGDDTYQLNAKNAKGSQIIDTKGSDTLELGNANISLNGLAKRKIGLAAKGQHLVIDINQDGKANNRDLTIKNFFASNKANKAGKGFIETVDNLSGNEVIQAFGNKKVQARSNDIEDTLIGDSDTLPGNETDDILTNVTDGETSQSGIDNAIADFIAGDADKIYLPEDQFPKLDPETDLAEQFAAVASDKAAATSDAYIVYNSNNGNLFYNANGNKPGLGSGGQFATLDGAPELDASDFII